MATAEKAEVIVVGAGPAGLTAAIALAQAGVPTALLGPAPSDNRTTALLAGSVTALTTLGVWQRCAGDAAPLRTMRFVDDTGRLLRAPEVKFDSGDIGLEAFGYNIANRNLIAALEARARELPQLVRVVDRVESVETGADGVAVRTMDAVYKAPLVIGADGRNSLCRAAAGIAIDTHDYPQSALTVCLTHSRPHRDISTEFHTSSGPFTLVPLRGNCSSLVWVLDPATAESIAAKTDDELSLLIEQRAHSILGKMKVEQGRGLFPLGTTRVRRFAAQRIALAGEAAHVMPPIGAQGLNLGLRDAAVISELAVAAWRDGRDCGGNDVMTAYDDARSRDVASRALAVDLFNRSLLSDFLPVQTARSVGLYLMDRIAPLRRAVMREGVAPALGEPPLMRGEAP